MGNLPSAGSYHGMFAHVHATGRGYFAHAGNWLELVNADTTGRVGTGTESYFIDRLVSTSTTATSLNVTGVTTAVTVDINGDLDVDGHTNLDNVSIAGVTTISQDLDVDGHTNLDNVSVAGVSTFSDNVRLIDGKKLQIGNSQDLQLHHTGGHSYIANSTGEISILNTNGTVHIRGVGNEAGIEVTNNETVKLYGASNTVRLVTSNTGVTVTGTVVADGADINGDLDVDGHTNLDNVSIAGITTFYPTGTTTRFFTTIDAQGDLDVDGHTELDNVNIVGVTTTAGHILPATDSTYDLGSSSKYWRHVYADNVTGGGGGVLSLIHI